MNANEMYESLSLFFLIPYECCNNNFSMYFLSFYALCSPKNLHSEYTKCLLHVHVQKEFAIANDRKVSLFLVVEREREREIIIFMIETHYI